MSLVNYGAMATAIAAQEPTPSASVARNWGAYNAATRHEHEMVAVMLCELLSSLPEEVQQRGRPRARLADLLFCNLMRVYGTKSLRRSARDLDEYARNGFLESIPSNSSIWTALSRPNVTPILREFTVRVAKCLTGIESDFAVDSTGFQVAGGKRWGIKKHGRASRRVWLKAHAMVGVRTNVVTAIEVAEGDSSDYKNFFT